MHALDLFDSQEDRSLARVVVTFGDESFLHDQVLARLRAIHLSSDDAEFSLSRWEGDTAQLRDVFDELATVGLFGGGIRVAVVSAADSFITRYRRELEDYVQSDGSSGVLILQAKAFAANTRLFKLVQQHGLAVACSAPPPHRLSIWIASWAKSRHSLNLTKSAVESTLDLVGPEMALIDQELAKLALIAEPEKPVSDELVHQVVGGWRSQTAWQLLDAALDGRPRKAIMQLDRLLQGGEHPIGILAQIASALRRLSSAAVAVEEAEAAGLRIAPRAALQQAGVKPFVLAKSESQLRRIGRARALRLADWALSTDLELKGASSSPRRARLALEQFLIRIAVPGTPSSGKASTARSAAG